MHREDKPVLITEEHVSCFSPNSLVSPLTPSFVYPTPYWMSGTILNPGYSKANQTDLISALKNLALCSDISKQVIRIQQDKCCDWGENSVLRVQILRIGL